MSSLALNTRSTLSMGENKEKWCKGAPLPNYAINFTATFEISIHKKTIRPVAVAAMLRQSGTKTQAISALEEDMDVAACRMPWINRKGEQ